MYFVFLDIAAWKMYLEGGYCQSQLRLAGLSSTMSCRKSVPIYMPVWISTNSEEKLLALTTETMINSGRFISCSNQVEIALILETNFHTAAVTNFSQLSWDNSLRITLSHFKIISFHFTFQEDEYFRLFPQRLYWMVKTEQEIIEETVYPK